MKHSAASVEEYLASLPEDRRAALSAVRAVILENLDSDYEEGMQYGMIGYYVPHRVFPAGYHCDPRQPLPFAGLASQKGHMSLYLMCIYGSTKEEAWFRDAWARTGKKLDMGKSCVRFKKLEDVALDVIGGAIRRVPAKAYIRQYQAMLGTTATSRAKLAATSASKPATKKKGPAREAAAKNSAKPAAKRPAKAAAKRAK